MIRRWLSLLLGYGNCIMCGKPLLTARSLTCSLTCEREFALATGPHDVPSPKLTEVK